MQAFQLPGVLGQLQAATIAARQRTGNSQIGTRVENGLIQVVAVDMAKRKTAVTPLSGWMPALDAVTALNAM